MVEIRHFNKELALVNGAFVAADYPLNMIFAMGQEVAELKNPKAIEIRAFAIMRHIDAVEEIRGMKIGEVREILKQSNGYRIKRLSQNFITAEELLLNVNENRREAKRENKRILCC